MLVLPQFDNNTFYYSCGIRDDFKIIYQNISFNNNTYILNVIQVKRYVSMKYIYIKCQYFIG